MVTRPRVLTERHARVCHSYRHVDIHIPRADAWPTEAEQWQPEGKVRVIEGMLHAGTLWLGRFDAGASALHLALRCQGLRSHVLR